MLLTGHQENVWIKRQGSYHQWGKLGYDKGNGSKEGNAHFLGLPFKGPYLVTWMNGLMLIALSWVAARVNNTCLQVKTPTTEKSRCPSHYSDANGSSDLLNEKSLAKLGVKVNLAKLLNTSPVLYSNCLSNCKGTLTWTTHVILGCVTASWTLSMILRCWKSVRSRLWQWLRCKWDVYTHRSTIFITWRP